MLLCTDITFIIQKKKHKLFCKRAGIEPTIGHLKTDYRLGRNFYKGLLGDAINVMLAAAAYNLKRAMKVLFRKFPAEIMSYDIRLLLTGKEITYSGNLYDREREKSYQVKSVKIDIAQSRTRNTTIWLNNVHFKEFFKQIWQKLQKALGLDNNRGFHL